MLKILKKPKLNKSLLVCFSVLFSTFLSSVFVANCAFAETTLVTNGTTQIGTFPTGIFGLPNTSWRINTSVTDSTVITPISSGFVGPSDAGLGDASAWTTDFNGSLDDGFRQISLGEGNTIPFNGTTYSNVFIGSNTYFTFGEGSTLFAGLSASNPAFPGVHMCSGDHSYQRIYYKFDDASTLRVRYEGTGTTSGAGGSPTIVYEAVFYKDQPYIDLFMGINNACSNGSGTPTISGDPQVGNLLTGSIGSWADPESLTFTYQWQKSSNGSDWTNIADANSETYTPGQSVFYEYLRFVVTGAVGEDSITTYSSPTARVYSLPVDTNENGPLDITSCQDLQMIKYGLSGSYELTSDIDCSMTNPTSNNFDGDGIWGDGYGFQPIGDTGNRFQGSLIGNGHTITGLFINLGETNYVGLFSVIDEGASVSDFGLVNVTVTGYDYVGALVGGLSGTVTNVYSSGTVNGHNYAGGLAGIHIVAGGIGSSSPLVYTWNGTQYSYIGDVGRGIPRNTVGNDSMPIDGSRFQPQDGKYRMQISEEYNEIVYYDELALKTFDHEPGFNIATSLERNKDDQFYTLSDTPTNPLLSCTDMYSNNCLSDLQSEDNLWSYKDDSNVNYWTMNFGDLSAASRILLIMKGAENYTLTSTQAIRYVQVKNAQGAWVTVVSKANISAPAGAPRNQVIDLTGKFLTDNYEVRVAFDKTRVNYFAVDTTPQQEYTVNTYHPSSVDLHFFGYTSINKEFFWDHDYSRVSSSPEEIFAGQSGNFTKYGDVTPLLQSTDDHHVVMHHGDQMTVDFKYVSPEEGVERDFVLYNWATFKHADIGALGRTVNPLPYVGMPTYTNSITYPLTEENQNYLDTWNTRVINESSEHGSTIIDSHSAAIVNGNAYVGGLVGDNEKLITGSYATGAVTATNGTAGGLAGESMNNDAIIQNSYATGTVTNSNNNTGGLVGYNTGTITDSYSTGDVIGTDNIGGFIGLDGTCGLCGVYNSFTTGNVTGGDGQSYVGGFIGSGTEWNYNTSNNYWYNNLVVAIPDGRDDSSSAIHAENAAYFKGADVATKAPFLEQWAFSGEDQKWVATAGFYPTLYLIAADDPAVLNDVYVNFNYDIGGNDCGDHTCNVDAFDNMEDAITAIAPGGTIHATNNWWGSATGPTINTNSSGTGTEIASGDYTVMYRPFCINEGCSDASTSSATPGSISTLFANGGTVLPVLDGFEDDEDPSTVLVTELNVAEDTVITIPVSTSDTVITLPAGTTITRHVAEGEPAATFDAAFLNATDMALNNFSGFVSDEEAVGAFQWGIPEIGLVFSQPIRIDMYVGTSYNGQTLTIKRSSSTSDGWSSTGILFITPDAGTDGTCVVTSEGICSFRATQASYYTAIKPVVAAVVNSGGGGGGSLPNTMKKNQSRLAKNTLPSNDLSSGHQFTDTVDHWSNKYVEDLFQKGFVKGYDETHFQPNKPITRAEFTKIVVTMLGLKLSTQPVTTFDDVIDAKDWFAAYVEAAVKANIVNGYSKTVFRPNAPITRAEALKVLVLAKVKTELPAYDNNFSDVAAKDWFATYIAYATKNGIVNGYEDKTFKPSANITRAEAAKIVSVIMGMK